MKRSFFDRVNEVGLSELLTRAMRAAEAAREGEDWVDRLARAARAFVDALPPALSPGDDEVERIPPGLHLERQETYSSVRWCIEAPKSARAARMLEGEGLLTLSLITLMSDDQARVTRAVESIPIAPEGERRFLANEENERRLVSIGLADGSRFVSIAHVVVD